MPKETKKFEAEVKQILDLMVHSLYSHKEIFLRELISNASDALDKIRYESISHPEWKIDTSKLEIRLSPDGDQNVFTLSDNGIGMSYEEVLKNIGTIAHSGTGQFLEKLNEAKNKPELIGQFGVGFYSSFMVADRVTLLTQKIGETEGTRWESSGDGSYSLEKLPRPEGNGTTITLQLKSDLDQKFTDEWTIKGIVKKYSDFIAFPIKMKTTQEEQEKDSSGNVIVGKKKKVIRDETLNSQKAMWLRAPKEVEEKEYQEFYKHLSHDWNDPLKHFHFRVEGTTEFAALLYIPSQLPMDYHFRDLKWGLQLYVKRVFILDHCEETLPPYLRFFKGVVDSSDLSLNVSREILQKDRQVDQIQKALTNKALGRLTEWIQGDRKSYEKFWDLFGSTLKEGIHSDQKNKDRLLDLLLFRSTHSSEYTTLGEYFDRMKPDQNSIFYFTGDRYEELKTSPVLERFKTKGFEVLLLTDPVDEWVTQSLEKYKEKEFRSVLDKEVDLDTEEEKKVREEKLQKSKEEISPVISAFKDTLSDQLEDVRVSSRLVSTPVCLISNGASARMERLLSAMGQDAPKSKRILELNPEHPIIKKMASLKPEVQKNWSKVLYSQALLQEGSPIENPVEFSKELGQMMEKM